MVLHRGRCPRRRLATIAAMSHVEDIDIWRSANLLVKRHGDNAAEIAHQRAVELDARGDMQGQAVWKRIRAAVVELQHDAGGGEPPH